MSAAQKRPAKAAIEVSKGARHVVVLGEADVEKHLDLHELLDGLEDGFRALERGEVQSPARPQITVPGEGFSLAMQAWRPGMQITVKIVSVFENNPEKGLPSHLAIINLIDPNTGAPACVMDGAYITGVRTAAAAVLSARMLSRRDSQVATVIGAGVQGREHLRLLPLVRDFARINVCSSRLEDAERLAARSEVARATTDVEAAVRESDVVCLASNSPTPTIEAGWVRRGSHVSSVGYCPPNGELPKDLASRNRLFVETVDAFKAVPVGCGELAGLDPSSGTTLGALALGRKPGRIDDDEITVYKAMGTAMEDMVAANLVYQKSRGSGGGALMPW